jgi:hypothetical protein
MATVRGADLFRRIRIDLMGIRSYVSATFLDGIGLPERYEVRGQIADGAMTSVWCAYDAALGHKVAIKVLSPQFAGDDLAAERFQHEARTAARLSAHPHVVRIYEVAEAAGRPYIVMEHLAGGTVADAFRVGAVRREETLRWLAEAASALDYAHGRGVVHRGIKPGNLLLGLDRSLHVADFGITRLPTQEAFSGSAHLLGTAAYLAPEQVLGAPASAASDRYALAVVAFEMMVGQRPFTAGQYAAVAGQHTDDPPAARADHRTQSGPVDAVLARGMAKRPEDRWATAGAFVDALVVAVTQPTQTRRVAAVTAPKRRPAHRAGTSRARRGRTAAIAALAAAGVAVGVVVAVPHESTAPHARISTTTLARLKPTPRGVHPSAPRPKPIRRRAAAPSTTARTTPATPVRTTPAIAQAAPDTATTQAGPGTTTTTQAAPGPATTTSTPSAPPAPPATVLEARGHQLMLDGDYAAAIPMLRRATAVASPRDITYAYALFDLGRSLRLGGDPQAAIPVLERRLQIPNQTPVVVSELRLAQRAGDGRGRAAGAPTHARRSRDRPRGHDRALDGGAAIRATAR